MTLVMYGAGAIGRGFIGAIFAQAGYEVVFIDINEEMLTEFNNRKSYTITVLGEKTEEISIQGVRAVNGNETEKVISEIANCDILAVSLGSKGLKEVSSILAKGLERRALESDSPLNILICENLKDSSRHLRGWIVEHLNNKELASTHLGLVETAIGRMVPRMTDEQKEDDVLAVYVEEYDFLPVDKEGFLGDIPNIPQLVPCSDFSFLEERALAMP